MVQIFLNYYPTYPTRRLFWGSRNTLYRLEKIPASRTAVRLEFLHRGYVRSVPNHSENGKYNLIWIGIHAA